MPKYRSYSTVDAMRAGEILDAASAGGFSSKNRTVPEWVVQAFDGGVIGFATNAVIIAREDEDDQLAERDDWVIKGVTGRLFLCKAEDFEKRYEEVP